MVTAKYYTFHPPTALKKIITILLLGLHVFNIAGYTAVFNILQQKASVNIVNQLDKGAYSDAELMEVKIPFPLPYANNWKAYERCDGEFEWSGVMYNYVKRMLYNDTLYLLCIPNQEKMKIADAKNGYTGFANDVSNASPGKKSLPFSSVAKNGVREYNAFPSYHLPAPLCVLVKKVYYITDIKPPMRFLPVPFQPPKRTDV